MKDMNTNIINNEEQPQTEADMFSFELAPQVLAAVEKVLPQMDTADAVAIPDTKGKVLVKDGTEACKSRSLEKNILMLPYTNEKDGVVYFVCSR
jgi:hypothetical protein